MNRKTPAEQAAEILPDQPLTLSGIPRVAGPAPEPPLEDVRNAVMILINNGVPHTDMEGNDFLTFESADITAVLARLKLADSKLVRGL